MANLKLYIWEGAQAGQPFDIYSGPFVKVGDGKWLTTEKLHIAVQGSVFGIGPKKVEIVMPDEAPSGHCKVIVDGSVYDKCPYKTEGKRLTIQNVDNRTLELEDQDKKWSWVGVSGVPEWIGLWPKGGDRELPPFGPEGRTT